MLLRLIITLALLTTPLKVLALSGVFTMQGVKFSQYLSTPTGVKTLYKIKAEKQVEVIPPNTLQLDQLLFGTIKNSDVAKNIFHYKNGTLIIPNQATIHFQFAYYFQGKLILERAYGVANKHHFSSSKMIYDYHQQILTANMIFIQDSARNGIVRNKNLLSM